METPETWLTRLLSTAPAPNRVVVRTRSPGGRRWLLVGTVALEGAAPGDALADVQQVIDHWDGEIGSIVLEAWHAGAKSPAERLPYPTQDLDTEPRHQGETPQATALTALVALVQEQRAYIRELHAASATMHQHVPLFSQKVLEKVIEIASHTERDRDRWEQLSLALLEHGGGGDSATKDRLRVLAREDLHHAGRALMHAAVAKLGGKGTPLAGPMLDSLRSFTASLEQRQLEKIRSVLTPEQSAALFAVMAAAEGDPSELEAEADTVDQDQQPS